MNQIKDFNRILGFIALELILGIFTESKYTILWISNFGLAIALMFLANKIEDLDKKKTRRKR